MSMTSEGRSKNSMYGSVHEFYVISSKTCNLDSPVQAATPIYSACKAHVNSCLVRETVETVVEAVVKIGETVETTNLVKENNRVSLFSFTLQRFPWFP